jgi:NADH dehydrogenase/NADH:ubiquinone oxidoreductase subunit G
MKLKINTQEIEASKSETLIEVAHRNGIEIPALCYVAGYHHQASCMVCVVKECVSGQILPACSTLAVEGMKIETTCEEVKELRKTSLELLLSDHIAECRPPCDVQNCKLRQYAIAYHAKWNKYPRYSAIKTTQPQHIKDDFWFDATKCIRCGLCVYNTKDGFTFKNRGFEMEIVCPAESVKNVDESLCEICPTQALYKI